MIKVFQNNKEMSYKRFNFSGGEVQIRFDETFQRNSPVNIFAVLKSSDDIMALMLIYDIIKNADVRNINLEMPYLPYARQDRVVYEGESFAVKVFTKILAICHFDKITVWDVHSEIGLQCLKSSNPVVINKTACEFIIPYLVKNEYVVAPDKGAVTRAKECSSENNPLLRMKKERDPDTGFLSKFSLEDTDVKPEYGAIIVDDICDGGRTFIGAGNILKQHLNGKLKLYVTHGIFSAGFDNLLETFDEIFVANLMTDKPIPPQVKVIGQMSH